MKNKGQKFVVLITTGIIIILSFFIPSEWKIVYSHLFSAASKELLILPVESVSIENIENTYNAKRSGGRIHLGVDIFAPRFTPVVCVCDGHVLKIGRDILGGNIVKILGIDKRVYYYAHLSRHTEYIPGDKVKKGKLIGFVGNTGNAISTPPHLHFEIMEIEWYFPLITKNINPYYELVESNSAKMN